MKTATSKLVPATRPRLSEWLDTSIAAAVTPRSAMTANSACKSGASGVVKELVTTSVPILISTPPTRPVRWPDSRSPASIRYVLVVLPLVPVTPISPSLLDGSPYTQQAISPSRARGSATTKTGTPLAVALARPSGSVSTATAPAATASAQYAAPCALAPGRAAYRSPGRTARESSVTPDTYPRSSGARELPTTVAGSSRTPSSELSADSGRCG